ncbi:ABC transporter ATP-binding protein [Sedimentitalea nanhaiensis]|uniref:Spermidine/putrescine import ATP-binding protein PotA n=1 Tax=Sedimentitalea nanhaiensis TaxID=999627 RepID=A0A1I7DAT5_9RHOB|nr:ABC transporter ATP-binding protein [Sedimentitalea nanhaiensis]SFU08724.1 spermidine/putrescine transport system ATP-binding protein [Sedimentitalea nanhaiensis]
MNVNSQPDIRSEAIAVDVDRVSKIFGGEPPVTALDDVSVAIRQNEFFTLLGPSGCGKTTLLRLIAGFEPPTSGSLRLGGRDISRLPPNKRPINTVFQNYALFPHMSVAANIAFGLQMLGKPKAEVRDTVDEMLKLVQMEALKNRRTSEISGGQQQRVALARALAPHPEVLLLDEPLSALDYKLRKEMQIELKRLQGETGITFIFVTHDQEEALTMSDRIAVMNAGKILQVGPPREIYNRPVNRFVADFIGETNFLTGTAQGDAVRISSGHMIAVPLDGRTGDVTLTVRPEQVRLCPVDQDGALHAEISDLVYFGTDTHCHLALKDGTQIVARLQSLPTGEVGYMRGQAVGLRFEPGAVQVVGA